MKRPCVRITRVFSEYYSPLLLFALYTAVILKATAQQLISMEELAQAAIESALRTGVSFADIRIEDTKTAVIEMVDGVTRRSLASRLKGAGLRAFIDGAWAFVQTTDLTPRGMREAGSSVAKMALATRSRVGERYDLSGPAFEGRVELKVQEPFDRLSMEEKVAFAKMIDDQTREFDKRISNTRTVYTELWTNLYVANSLGTKVYIENALPRITANPTAKDGSSKQRAFKTLSMRGGFELMRTKQAQTIGEEAAKLAVELLSSVAVEGDVYDVIMDPIFNGVMVHEAFGHACEADSWLAHQTVLEGKVGETVGPDNMNLSDDPTLPGQRGTFEYDWEGTKTKKRRLVVNGVLTNLLHSLETSCRLGMEANGAARAQSFMSPPIPRMSNTFMEPGNWGVDELIRDTKRGVLLCDFNYGYTEPSKGQFMFQASYGYMIENGELGQIVRDASIAGQILEVLPKVDAIGNDLRMEAGTCGKDGQMVPDNSGGPHARVRAVPVGGM